MDHSIDPSRTVSIYGINVIVLGTTLFLIGLVYDRTGSYTLAFLVIGAGLMLCAAFWLSLPR